MKKLLAVCVIAICFCVGGSISVYANPIINWVPNEPGPDEGAGFWHCRYIDFGGINDFHTTAPTDPEYPPTLVATDADGNPVEFDSLSYSDETGVYSYEITQGSNAVDVELIVYDFDQQTYGELGPYVQWTLDGEPLATGGSPIPEPGTVFIFGSILSGFGVLTKRFKLF